MGWTKGARGGRNARRTREDEGDEKKWEKWKLRRPRLRESFGIELQIELVQLIGIWNQERESGNRYPKRVWR
jgi:hypothetical protein